MHNQPYLDAMLGVNPLHASHSMHQPQLTSTSFGVLPISPEPSCSGSLGGMDNGRYGASSNFAHDSRSHHFQTMSSSTVDLSDYEMMQLLTPVASRSTCRCGGNSGAEAQPRYQVQHGNGMSAGNLGHHYGAFVQSPVESIPLQHSNTPMQNMYYLGSSSKAKSSDAAYFSSDYSSVADVPFDGLDSWDAMNAELLSSMNQLIPPAELATFLPPSPYYETSPDTSPSPSASPKSDDSEYFSALFESPTDSRRPQPPSPKQPPVKQCSHCRATSTPLWRREPTTLKPLCNACGLYLQQRNKLRPQELIDADDDDDVPSEPGDLSGPECSHCHTRQTSVWRRSKTGAQLCNACGVYSRLRGKDRPLSLKRNKIKPRSKHPSAK